MGQQGYLGIGAILVAALALVGCGKKDQGAPAGGTTPVVDTGHGWWCTEHGVPEEVCALCSTKLAAKFKAEGDWCKMHDRPESQCFACHPELEAKFAAQYEAKYGKQPPKPDAAGAAHDHDHEHEKKPG